MSSRHTNVVNISKGKTTSDDANDISIEELTWQEAKAKVRKVNPKLHDIIDEWNPGPEYTLFKVIYPFGTNVLADGTLNLPYKGNRTIPINHHTVPRHIRDKLTYSSFPLGLIIENGNEVFLEMVDRIISLAFFNPGEILGLWEALDPPTSHFPKRIWKVSAGARSLFMLPKIADAGAHEKLKRQYGVRTPLPKKLRYHWRVFKEIASHPNFTATWQNEIFFFSSKWVEKSKDPGWLNFHHFLLQEAWKLSAYARNETTRSIIWELFARSLTKKGIKPNPYLMDTLKHLVAIGVGGFPGSKPAGSSQQAGPIQAFQSIYIDTYKLDYSPTIMAPYHLHMDDNCKAVYYSLHAPTLFESLPKAKTTGSLLSDLRSLKSLLEHFIEEALDGNLKIENTPLQIIIDNINYDFFHSEQDTYGEIRPTKEMPQEDESLFKIPHINKDMPFAESSPFTRGCIRISKILN